MGELEKGLIVQIESYKHNGSIHRVWKKNIILEVNDAFIIGVNDKTEVIESDGKTWVTKEPGVFYFAQQWWFNVIGLIHSDDVHYYCNMSSPFVYKNKTIKYIDYDLDVKVYPDMTYHVLDCVEFHMNKKRMNYPRDLDYILNGQLGDLLALIKKKQEPFSSQWIMHWYDRYIMNYSQLE